MKTSKSPLNLAFSRKEWAIALSLFPDQQKAILVCLGTGTKTNQAIANSLLKSINSVSGQVTRLRRRRVVAAKPDKTYQVVNPGFAEWLESQPLGEYCDLTPDRAKAIVHERFLQAIAPIYLTLESQKLITGDIPRLNQTLLESMTREIAERWHYD